MNIQQVWLIVSTLVSVLLLTVVIVTAIVGFIYIISVILKNKLGINKQERWYEIAVAGSIILVTGQLIGALCGVMFPIWFGSDTSDYSLSCRPISFSYEYNSELLKYNDNTTWTNATPDLIFATKIYATNLHPLRDYNQQIYLEIITPKGINSSTADFAIRAGNCTTLSIYTYNKTALDPGKYTITVRGTGGDGKSRECKLFLTIYRIFYINSMSNELKNVSIKTIDTTSGTAIIAIRPNDVFGLEHIGVGYQNSNGNYFCGAVEGKNNLNIAPGDDNGAWIKAYQDIEGVKGAFRSRGYSSIKVISVDITNPENAGSVIQNFATRGYNLANNNCLTATDEVLRAYGVRDLPNPTTPNEYYNQISGAEYDL